MSALGRSTVSICSSLRPPIRALSMTPAAWTTAVRGRSSGMPASSRASASRSPVSQAAIRTRAPSSVRSATRVSAPGASAPLRLTSSRSRLRWSVTRCRATRRPRSPVPPVTSTVPSGFQPSVPPTPAVTPSGAPSTRWSRGTRGPPSRRASWGSPRTAYAASTACGVSGVSWSSRTTRPGSSSCAERTSPHTAAWARPLASPAASPAPVSTARCVTTASTEPASLSSPSRARSPVRVWCTAARTRAGTSSAAAPGPAGVIAAPVADTGSSTTSGARTSPSPTASTRVAQSG